MKPDEEAPAPKDSPAAQVVFQDFYRVDEPITPERLAEIAPQMKPTRRRPNSNSRPASRAAKTEGRAIQRLGLPPLKEPPAQ